MDRATYDLHFRKKKQRPSSLLSLSDSEDSKYTGELATMTEHREKWLHSVSTERSPKADVKINQPKQTRSNQTKNSQQKSSTQVWSLWITDTARAVQIFCSVNIQLSAKKKKKKKKHQAYESQTQLELFKYSAFSFQPIKKNAHAITSFMNHRHCWSCSNFLLALHSAFSRLKS